jgi:carboxyl-terminal processing protease
MKNLFKSKFTIWSVVYSAIIASILTAAVINIFTPEVQPQTIVQEVANENKNVQKIVDVYETLSASYYQEVDEFELFQSAIRGMIGSLDDPYTAYYDIEQSKRFSEEMSGSYEGIGVSFNVIDGVVTVDTPRKGSPAEQAGILPNDQFIEVNRENIVDMDTQEIVSKIRGEKGTEVELGIRRNNQSELIYITVVRDVIPIDTVYSELYDMNGETIAYLDITQFIDTTYREMVTKLEEIGLENIDGLVIDLRRNPGGYLHIVEEMMDYFIADNEVIYNIEDDGKIYATFSDTDAVYSGEMVILIDEGSASASEIFAATLNEINGVDLIGKTTYGKGTVQSYKQLEDGSALKYTSQKWLTPNQNWIHQVGVAPTIEVSQPDVFYLPPIVIEETILYDTVSPQAIAMQLILNEMGYELRTDGYFDSLSVDALKEFQTEKGLEVTGELNKETASELENMIRIIIRDESNDLQLQEALNYFGGN